MGFLSAALLLAVSGQQLANAKRNSGDRDAVKTDVSSMLNFNCKNASSDWPVCRPPSDGYKLRFGAGSGAGANSFPISAWWGPIGYGAGKSAGYTELDAYAKANFTMVMVSDRNNRLDAQNRTLNCDASDPSRGWQASLDYLDVQVDQVEKRGMQSIFDTYRCLPWGGAANAGGASQGGGGWVAEKHGAPHNHKVTLPEVQFLARRMRNRTSCVGLLITDDGVDLHENELAEVKWMRKNTPELYPWVNQCGDGSEWLARAGTPYAVPELYAVEGVTEKHPSVLPAVTMARQLIQTFDSWSVDKSDRFGLGFFPLLNLGDGGDTGLVRSDSLVRFSGFSSVAYNAKGIWWYCWSNGAWNIKANTPVPVVYDTLSEVNTKLRAWGPKVLAYGRFEGTYASEWAGAEPLPLGPAKSTNAAGAGQLLTKMDPALLVGVLSSSDAALKDRQLLVVVDKRVSSTANALKPRTAGLTINPAFAAKVSVVADDGSATVSGGTVTARLAAGGAVLLEVTSADAVRFAAGLRKWRYDAAQPDLSSIRTSQYSFYEYTYKQRPQTKMLLMASGFESDATTVGALARAGVNALSVPAARNVHAALNDAMRQGLLVFVESEALPASAAAAAKLLQPHDCHPSFGGLKIAAGVSSSDAAAMTSVRKLMQHDYPHLFGLSSSEADALSLQHTSGLPTIGLRLSTATAAFAPVAAQLGAVRLARTADGGNVSAFLVETGCGTAGDAVSARFGMFAAVAFGAKGLMLGRCGADAMATVQTTFGNAIAQWGDYLLSATVETIVSSVSFAVPGAVKTDPLILKQSPGLLVSILQPPNRTASPPSLLVVNAQPATRNVSVSLAHSVIGWAPEVGSYETGFKSCQLQVLGAEVILALRGGEGMLLSLAMVQPPAALKTDDAATPAPTVVSPSWATVLSTTRAVPTHQDAISNAFDPRSPLSKPGYARMAELAATNVRYLHWTSGGAPIPETVEGTWDSAACDEYVSSFMAAPNAQTAVVNFNWPTWLHVGNSSRNMYRDMTGAELGRWLSKIISWYTKGGYDAAHKSPYNFAWRHYEVFNEPHHGMEHWPCAKAAPSACAILYARLFDGVAAVLRADHPELQLHALSDDWKNTMDKDMIWSKAFFTAANHAADAKPPEFASYHFYAFLPPGRAVDMSRFNVSYVFAQAAAFVKQAKAIRAQIDGADWGAKTRLNFNEVGLIGGSGCPLHDEKRGAAKLFIDNKLFFNLGSAMFAYAYGELAAIGADIIAASQTLAFNGTALHPAPFYPCLTLIDWVPPYGGNARFWGLKVMIDVLGSDLKSVVAVNISGGEAPPAWWPTASLVYAAAFVKHDGRRVVLLANTNSSDLEVRLEGATGCAIHVVDADHGNGFVPYSNATLSSETIVLAPLAVALVEMPTHEASAALKTDDAANFKHGFTNLSGTVPLPTSLHLHYQHAELGVLISSGMGTSARSSCGRRSRTGSASLPTLCCSTAPTS